MCCLNDLELQKIKNNDESFDKLKKNSDSKGNNNSINKISTTLNLLCDVDTLRSLIKENKVRVVDVRKKDDYLKGHVPTAVCLSLAELLYDDTFGALASRVAWSFKFVGHKYVSLLEVTYSRWKNLGLEIEQNPNSFNKSSHS